MKEASSKGAGNFFPFILGGFTGGLLALLFTPFSGEQFRQRVISGADDIIRSAKKKEDEIISEAKKTGDSLILKAIRVGALTDKYAGGLLGIPAEKIELEIKSLKAAIDAAVKSYKRNGNPEYRTLFNKAVDRDGNDNPENIFSDYDNVVLPKHEGMKRRLRLKLK